MGLQTGTKLAQTKSPIIDPANLRIVAYVVEGPLLSEKPSILRTVDIREQGEVGMIIDSSDEFIGIDDVIKIKELYDLSFVLNGTSVIDETNHKLGKIEDYSVEIENFDVTQLNVKRGVFKGLNETGLLIHRSQIVEINNENIIVRTTAQKLEPVMKSERRTFINPFKSANPQIDNTKI